jgi:hypothetical protein
MPRRRRASQQYGVWQGTVDKCVTTPGPFDCIDTPGYTCADGEELVKFTEKLPSRRPTPHRDAALNVGAPESGLPGDRAARGRGCRGGGAQRLRRRRERRCRRRGHFLTGDGRGCRGLARQLRQQGRARGAALSGIALWRTCATPGVAGSAAIPTSAAVIKERRFIRELQGRSGCRLVRLRSVQCTDSGRTRQRFVRSPLYTPFFMSKA